MLLTKSETIIKPSLGNFAPDYKREEVETPGYIDVSSVQNISDYGLNLCTDYLQFRSWLAETLGAAGGWGSLTTAEKLIIINNQVDDPTSDYATSDINKITYLISESICVDSDAAKLHLETVIYPEFHQKEKASCVARGSSKTLTAIALKYLTMADAEDLARTVDTLHEYFMNRGIIGTNYNRIARNGIVDYFEDTGDYASTGLSVKGYTYKNGLTEQDMINEYKEVYVNGNYEKDA